jgi:hypothetical protein
LHPTLQRELERQMTLAEQGIARYRSTLRALAG